MNILKRSIYIEKILNKYQARLFNDVVVLYGPVKMKDFVRLKNFIFMNRLGMKIIVKE